MWYSSAQAIAALISTRSSLIREAGAFQPQPDGGIFRYPPEGFGGMGRITGRVLPCLSAEVQLSCHVGYEPDEKDRHDVA